MSLIGSLEDLNLGDILQIIYLSQKSGALVIRSDEGEGRILFREGLVCGGRLKSDPADLRSLLVGGGFLGQADFDPIALTCGPEAGALEAALLARGLITAERLDSLRRESVEAAVAAMFHWSSGDFSFDLSRESDSVDPQLVLTQGINPQFLAMERVRLEDETGRVQADQDEYDENDPNEMSAEEMFGVVPDDSEPAPRPEPAAAAGEAVNALAMMTAERIAAEPGELEPAHELATAEVQGPISPREEAADPIGAHPAPAHRSPASRAAMVVIDPNLVALEWVKKALKPQGHLVHIFQRPDLGLSRIRQYLARGETPALLVSPAIPGDRATGIADASDFVRRLRSQAPSMSIFWLCEEDGVQPPTSNPADEVLMRPADRAFRRPGSLRRIEALAVELRRALTGEQAAPAAGDPEAAAGLRKSQSPEPLVAREDCEIAKSLGHACSRVEILPLVIRHARETFARVAMFMVREDQVMGIAQSGLEACGGPDDQGMRGMNFEGESSAWLRGVLTTHRPLVAAPRGDGDFELARRLGELPASEAYLAPIESGGRVVALLYADNLPGNEPIGDTSGVELALEHAGFALDREVHERTLAQES